MKSAVIIPVYNEGERLIPVLEASLGSNSIGEVIVVNDGSTDNTNKVLDDIKDITVIEHERNLGKGEALDTGVNHAIDLGYDTAVFLDGDLKGISPSHIDLLLNPLSNGSIMTIGYLGLRKEVIKKAVLNNWGALSGQRAIKTSLWELLTETDKHGFNIEAALNARLRRQNLHHSITRVALEGVSHTGKHEKLASWPKALLAYYKTYSSALNTYLRIETE